MVVVGMPVVVEVFMVVVGMPMVVEVFMVVVGDEAGKNSNYSPTRRVCLPVSWVCTSSGYINSSASICIYAFALPNSLYRQNRISPKSYALALQYLGETFKNCDKLDLGRRIFRIFKPST